LREKQTREQATFGEWLTSSNLQSTAGSLHGWKSYSYTGKKTVQPPKQRLKPESLRRDTWISTQTKRPLTQKGNKPKREKTLDFYQEPTSTETKSQPTSAPRGTISPPEREKKQKKKQGVIGTGKGL